MDVVLCPNNDDKLFWYQNSGTGVFTKLVVDANVDAPREVEAADLDGDGDIDWRLHVVARLIQLLFTSTMEAKFYEANCIYKE